MNFVSSNQNKVLNYLLKTHLDATKRAIASVQEPSKILSSKGLIKNKRKGLFGGNRSLHTRAATFSPRLHKAFSPCEVLLHLKEDH